MKIQGFGTTTEERIKELEQKYALVLPTDYKNFLLQFNGGVVEADNENTLRIIELDQSIEVEILYGLDASRDCFDIDYWMREYGGELPNSALIIGDDSLKGFLILICDKDNEGLYYWDDGRNFPESTDEKNAYHISGC